MEGEHRGGRLCARIGVPVAGGLTIHDRTSLSQSFALRMESPAVSWAAESHPTRSNPTTDDWITGDQCDLAASNSWLAPNDVRVAGLIEHLINARSATRRRLVPTTDPEPQR